MIHEWNDDKKHRCPVCHTVAVENPQSWKVYDCCRCEARFTRWPWLAWLLPKVGVVCKYVNEPDHWTIRD